MSAVPFNAHLHASLYIHVGVCVCIETRTAALLATGSQDATILVHSLSAQVKEPLQRYPGHQGLVTAITHQHGQLISGSWDG